MVWCLEKIPTQRIANKEVIILISTAKQFTERHQSIAQQMEAVSLKGYHITQFEPETISTEVRCRQREGLSLSTAKLSNLHKQLWAQFALATHPSASICLLLEDDAILCHQFRTHLEKVITATKTLTPPWIISLGGFDDSRDLKSPRPHPLLLKQPMTTAEAYLFEPIGAERRIEWFEANGIIASNDHQLQLSSAACGIEQLMVVTPLAHQGSASGKFQTTMDGFRMRKSATFLTIRFYWNALRKRVVPAMFHRFFNKR